MPGVEGGDARGAGKGGLRAAKPRQRRGTRASPEGTRGEGVDGHEGGGEACAERARGGGNEARCCGNQAGEGSALRGPEEEEEEEERKKEKEQGGRVRTTGRPGRTGTVRALRETRGSAAASGSQGRLRGDGGGRRGTPARGRAQEAGSRPARELQTPHPPLRGGGGSAAGGSRNPAEPPPPPPPLGGRSSRSMRCCCSGPALARLLRHDRCPRRRKRRPRGHWRLSERPTGSRPPRSLGPRTARLRAPQRRAPSALASSLP